MDTMTGKPGALPEAMIPIDERSLRERVAVEAAYQFGSYRWRLVRNSERHRIYGVDVGVYPDLVALDASDSGVAWILEVATPTSITEDAAWSRWRRAAETGVPFILAVPTGCGRMAEELAAMLDLRLGLVYEYRLNLGGVEFSAPQRPAGRPSA